MTRPATLAFVLILAAALVPTGIPRAQAADAALHEVSGIVLSDSDEPLPGAVVYAYVSSPDGSSATEDKATVGEDGKFVLHLGDGAGNLNVYYEKWPQSYANREIKVSGADVTGLKLVLNAPPPKTAILTGHVFDANGKPIEGATVQIGYGCCVMYSKDAVGPTPTPATVTDPAEGNSTSASSGSGIATPESSMPIRCCCCPYYNDQDSAITDADGAFKLSSYGGSHTLTAFAKGYAQTQVQVDTKDNATVKKDIKLLKVPASDAVIEGRVLDAKTKLPIANAGVSINNLEWSGRYLYQVTGADGKFRFENTLPGWSEIDVYVQNYGGGPVILEKDGVTSSSSDIASVANGKTYYAYSRTLAIHSGANTLDVNLQPRADANVILLGYVVDPTTKKGVEGANVNVWDQDTGDWGSATTDATGSYKIMVRPGHFTINAYAPGHLNGAQTFVIDASEKTKRVDIETPAGETRYAGCEDADCRGYPMPMAAYAMDASKSSSTGGSAESAPTTPTSTTALGGAPSDQGTQSTSTTLKADGQSAGPDSTRAAAFTGTGGGLPAYDANAPENAAAANGGTDSTSTGQSGAKTVSAAGIVLVLGIAGAIALAARRR